MKTKNSQTKIEAQNLIPYTWSFPDPLEAIEDIIFLGKITIREMIRFWRKKSSILAKIIKDVNEVWDSSANEGVMGDWALKVIGDDLFKILVRVKLGKKEIDEKVKFLQKLEKQAEKKPALPMRRPLDWFQEGDEVLCYIKGLNHKLVEENWVLGHVARGYSHHDGVVHIKFDKKVHAGKNFEGFKVSYSNSGLEVVHVWEFEYLVENPGFAHFWVNCVCENITDLSFQQDLIPDLVDFKTN